jgi:hypothetical protein
MTLRVKVGLIGLVMLLLHLRHLLLVLVLPLVEVMIFKLRGALVLGFKPTWRLLERRGD